MAGASIRTVTFRATALLGITIALGIAHASPARAEPRSAVAEELFLEGRRLVDAGAIADGCAKLSQSQKLEPSAGTLLNLADCQERLGKIATAWATFREAARAAADRGRADWRRLAERRAAVLEARVSRVVLDMDPDVRATPSLELKCDGVALDPAMLDRPLPLDPGPHVIDAAAPGTVPVRLTVRVRDHGDVVTLTIPKLVTERRESPPAEVRGGRPDDPVREREQGRSVQRALGLGVAGLGAAGVVTSLVTGLLASSSVAEAKAECPTYPVFREPLCSPQSADTNDSARSLATTSTIAMIAGGALLALGAALYFTAPRLASVARLGPRSLVMSF